MLTSEIRSKFLEFFEKNGHRIVESSSVVPHNDPTLLFSNSGMVQFKNVFTELETRDYKRATTSQKCIRAGGKHNDLDQVGFTARHHTFFEMLGNFSFGDYFKEEAIQFAWTFLTKELGVPKDKLLATIYHTDEESEHIWRKVAGSELTIIPIATSDNFWSMGDVGPCGPCSEIFYDHGDKIFGGMPGTANENGDRYIEIWNIVFMQFEQKIGGERIPLRNQSIDTGMGLERIASVMQGVHDNYEIDLFRGLIEHVKEISQTNHGNTYPSYKVIADHIRSISFLIADGVFPSNEGRGYVLRRILRRAMRHGNMIGIKNPFLFKICNTLIEIMGAAYPELGKARSTMESTIHGEEEKFLETLDRGLKILQNDIKNIEPGERLSGSVAFKLYDTYGFPLDLTQDILKSENIAVDIAGFDEALEEQRNRAKWAGSGEKKEDAVWHALKEKLPAIDFVGYEYESTNGNVLAIIVDGLEVSITSASTKENGSRIFLVTSATPFYAECGGQCGDTGVIKISEYALFRVTNTLKFCDTIIAHEGEVVSGEFKVSDCVSLHINSEKRKKIMANHTATHLLQAALKNVLGNHIAQRGSFLNDDRLRFDFSHNAAISKENIHKIESIINGWIMQNLQVQHKTLSKNEAISSGATALFGEKYSDFVRTICIYDKTSSDCANNKVSFELCGGTHVSNTSEIGAFKIMSESSIGSGIRRIEAIVGTKVMQYLNDLEQIIDDASCLLKCNTSDIPQKISDFIAELKKKNQEIAIIRQKKAIDEANIIEKPGANVVSIVVSDYNIDELRSISELLKSKYSSNSIALVFSKEESSEKIHAIVNVSNDLQQKYNAGNILKIGLAIFNGKGGGSASFASGGGVGNKSKIMSAMKKMLEEI